MLTLVKAFGVTVMVMLVSVAHSQTQSCPKKLLKHSNSCAVYQLSSKNTVCLADGYRDPGFSFFMKPGNHFNSLVIRMDSIGHFSDSFKDFEVKRSFLNSPEEWYKIHLSKGTHWDYHLSVNDEIVFTDQQQVTKDYWFTVRINGSFFYSKECNREDLPQPKGSWWLILIYVIVGVAFIVLMAAIVIAVVLQNKWKWTKEDEINIVNEERGMSNTTFNDPDRHTLEPGSFNFNESDDPANNIYEEIEEYNISEDQRGPIIFDDDNGGQSVSFHHATPGRHNILNQPDNASQSRRGSAHNSENSLYGYI